MNTHQLENILKQDRFTGPIFKGVFPIDQVPKFDTGACIVNTSPSTENSGHWVALYVTEHEVEYFDSYGGDPPMLLKRKWKTKSWNSNPIPLQSPLSAVCGQYCIYYLLHRARGIDLSSFLLDFSADVDDNDQLVYDFVEDRYDLDHLKLLDTEAVILQLARACISDPSIRNPMSGQ